MNVQKTDKILVVLGGPSTEAEVSRRTGGAIAEALLAAGYNVETLEFIPEQFVHDLERIRPVVVFNALHGKYGEDGTIQSLLEMLHIPYTGSGPLASAITMDKVVSKRLFLQAGLPTAVAEMYWNTDAREGMLEDITKKFGFPVVIKAANQGSTIGVTIAHNKVELVAAVEEAFRYDAWLLAEAFLAGGEFTVSVLNGKALPVIKIVPHSGMYDYQSKYTSGATDYLVPAPIDAELTQKMQEISQAACRIMGTVGAARVDMMTDRDGNPFILEINTVPGMTSTSLVPKAAQAVGITFTELCEAILSTAATGKL